MKIEYMQEYLILAEELNFSTAADRLFISQSVLSRHLHAIEAEIGGPLLQRTTHHVALTPLGIETQNHFKRITAEYQSLLTYAKNYFGQVSGRLIIGLLYFSMNENYGDFLYAFKKKYPSIKLEIRTYQPHEMYRDLLNGGIDIGEMTYANYPDASMLHFHKLFPTNFIAIMSNQHSFANKKIVTLEELTSETLIDLKDDFCSRICCQELFQKAGISFTKHFETENIETVPMAIKECNGIHITGEACKRQNCAGLSYIPIHLSHMVVDNCFIHRIDNNNPLISLFLKEADLFFHA